MANAVERLSGAFGNQMVARSYRPEDGAPNSAAFQRDSDSEDGSGSEDGGPKKPEFGVAPEEVGPGPLTLAQLDEGLGHGNGLKGWSGTAARALAHQQTASMTPSGQARQLHAARLLHGTWVRREWLGPRRCAHGYPRHGVACMHAAPRLRTVRLA